MPAAIVSPSEEETGRVGECAHLIVKAVIVVGYGEWRRNEQPTARCNSTIGSEGRASVGRNGCIYIHQCVVNGIVAPVVPHRADGSIRSHGDRRHKLISEARV